VTNESETSNENAADVRAGRLLELLDVTPPALDADQLIFLARSRAHALEGTDVASVRGGRGRRLAGGGALALLAAGAAAALPPSPLHPLALRVLRAVGFTQEAPQAQTAPPLAAAPAAAPGGPPTSVSITPRGSVAISFMAEQQGGTIHLAVLPAADASVAARRGTVRGFRVAANEVVVDNRGDTASYDVTLPRDVGAATITIAGRRVFEHDTARESSALWRDSSARLAIHFARLTSTTTRP